MCKSDVVVGVVASDAVRSKLLELGELRGREHHQRRQELFEDISVAFEQHAEKLPDIVRYKIDLHSITDALFFNGLVAYLQSQDFVERQDVSAAKIEVGVLRWKAINMRAADRRKEQGIRVLADLRN